MQRKLLACRVHVVTKLFTLLLMILVHRYLLVETCIVCNYNCRKIVRVHISHLFQHTLAKLYIEILGLGKDSPSAQKLLNYRAPKAARGVSIYIN